MNWIRSISVLILGNVTLCLVLVLTTSLLDEHGSVVNLVGASVIFLLITLLTLFLARHFISVNPKASLLGVMGVSTFGRIAISLIWILIFKEWQGEFGKYQLLEFILIYVYYLIADVLLMGRIAKTA